MEYKEIYLKLKIGLVVNFIDAFYIIAFMQNTVPNPQIEEHEKIYQPTSRTYEKLLDDRAQYIDLNKVYKFQPMYAKGNEYNYGNILRGTHKKNLLNQVFFSKQNMINLDARLRYTVYKMSDGQYSLGPQEMTELLIIMRSIYLTYATNYTPSVDEVRNQVKYLNDIVVSTTAPKLFALTSQHLRYLEDANEAHKIIIARAVNVNNKGTKTLHVDRALGFGTVQSFV